MFLMSACHNLRMSGITENWIDWVLHPKWFFSYKSLLPESKFFGNYGYPDKIFKILFSITCYVRKSF